MDVEPDERQKYGKSINFAVIYVQIDARYTWLRYKRQRPQIEQQELQRALHLHVRGNAAGYSDHRQLGAQGGGPGQWLTRAGGKRGGGTLA
jgi:hypothetical protein